MPNHLTQTKKIYEQAIRQLSRKEWPAAITSLTTALERIDQVKIFKDEAKRTKANIIIAMANAVQSSVDDNVQTKSMADNIIKMYSDAVIQLESISKKTPNDYLIYAESLFKLILIKIGKYRFNELLAQSYCDEVKATEYLNKISLFVNEVKASPHTERVKNLFDNIAKAYHHLAEINANKCVEEEQISSNKQLQPNNQQNHNAFFYIAEELINFAIETLKQGPNYEQDDNYWRLSCALNCLKSNLYFCTSDNRVVDSFRIVFDHAKRIKEFTIEDITSINNAYTDCAVSLRETDNPDVYHCELSVELDLERIKFMVSLLASHNSQEIIKAIFNGISEGFKSIHLAYSEIYGNANFGVLASDFAQKCFVAGGPQSYDLFSNDYIRKLNKYALSLSQTEPESKALQSYNICIMLMLANSRFLYFPNLILLSFLQEKCDRDLFQPLSHLLNEMHLPGITDDDNSDDVSSDKQIIFSSDVEEAADVPAFRKRKASQLMGSSPLIFLADNSQRNRSKKSKQDPGTNNQELNARKGFNL